jgi:hypothetical protein
MNPLLGLAIFGLTVGAVRALNNVGQPSYEVVIDTYESGEVPILTHTFRGKSREQAWGFVKAHAKYDSFFRDCGEKGRFANFTCRNVVRRDGWK